MRAHLFLASCCLVLELRHCGLSQVAPAQQVAQVELPGAARGTEAALHVGARVHGLQEGHHPVQAVGRQPRVQHACSRVPASVAASVRAYPQLATRHCVVRMGCWHPCMLATRHVHGWGCGVRTGDEQQVGCLEQLDVDARESVEEGPGQPLAPTTLPPNNKIL